MANKYFGDEIDRASFSGVYFELRSALALNLLQHYGLVAAKRGTDDSAGRSALELTTPEETVARCFKLADLFVETSESRGDIQKAAAMPERAQMLGEFERAKMDHCWRNSKEKQAVDSSSK